jgi:hypothetical protein
MTAIETFVTGLIDRLIAMLINELQLWLEQPGNIEKALTYLDEVLASANINVTPPAPADVTPPAPAPTGAPAPAASAAPATERPHSWFPGLNK